jgi:hypothetical protein
MRDAHANVARMAMTALTAGRPVPDMYRHDRRRT